MAHTTAITTAVTPSKFFRCINPPISSFTWFVFAANGSAGLPGTLIASGQNDPITSSQFLGYNTNYPYYQDTFGLPGFTVAPGSYYLAFEAFGSDYGVYLTQGLLPSGAADGFFNGQTWSWASG